MSDEDKKSVENAPDPEQRDPVQHQRRRFLMGLGKWSQAVILGAAFGGTLLGGGQSARAHWYNHGGGGCGGYNHGGGGGGWYNHGGGGWYNHGGWVNGGGGWINGGWYNHGGGWINGGWNNHGGGWINHGGGWYNHGGGWVNRRGGGSWVNLRR